MKKSTLLVFSSVIGIILLYKIVTPLVRKKLSSNNILQSLAEFGPVSGSMDTQVHEAEGFCGSCV